MYASLIVISSSPGGRRKSELTRIALLRARSENKSLSRSSKHPRSLIKSTDSLRRFNTFVPEIGGCGVEGEVVWMQTVSPSLEYLVDVMSSDPKIVPMPEEIAGKMIYGWTYDEDGFHEPTEEQ
jgi:hypothetical protein